MLEVILSFLGVVLLLTGFIFGFIVLFRNTKYHKKQVERSLKMIPFLITIPQNTGEEKIAGYRDQREVGRELIAIAENMFNTLFAIYKGGIKNVLKNFIYRPRHIALEIVTTKKEISFYMVTPFVLASMVEKAVTTHYPEAQIKETEEHNIFSQEREMNGVGGKCLFGYKNYLYPIKTYMSIDNEPLEAITNAMSMLEEDEGAAIQILLRPCNPKRMAEAKKLAQTIQKGPGQKNSITKELISPGSQEQKPPEVYRTTPMEEQVVKEVERKASKFCFETRIRVIVAARDNNRADLVMNQIKSAFAQFSDLSINGFKWRKDRKLQRLIDNFIFRFFDDSIFNFERILPKQRGYRLVLNSEELASIFHLPSILVKTPGIKWLPAKSSSVPINLPSEGTLFAKTNFRGQEEPVYITPNDKLRHVYIIGQTGTGKSVMMRNMIIDDIKAGNGICFIDPHSDGANDIIAQIPKERAEDVVIFDASDTERPLGLNLFEAKSIEQKDFVIQEAITMLYRLYDPGHTGIMGPRFEHWFRNAALAIMADPAGGTFIEVPRIFTDDKYLAEKLKFVQDPVVRNFWTSEMGQTAEFHKSEVLGWFVGKFGAFMTNTTMRNILGQTQSSLNLREIMDQKKILIVNLSKGIIGELNMQLLGMIFISKIQMAAMSRADMPEEQRLPFYLYVDEFQNFATDNFAQILSESRKYRLSLIVANQFIAQLRDDIKNAVFGNVGSLISFRVGAEDGEFVGKQFAPEFAVSDIINQENYHAIVKMVVNGLPSRPFAILSIPPPLVEHPEVGKAIHELSRLKYGRPRDIVDAEIQEKMKIDTQIQEPTGFPREGGGG